MKPGLEMDGEFAVGRDPREMTVEELQSLGHEGLPVLAALRARCLDCCAGQPSEVRKCVSVQCPSWPYRMGTNPFRKKREMDEEEREAIAERLRKAREAGR